MTNSKGPPAFASSCPKGHRLQGFVRFCPYCGVDMLLAAVASNEATNFNASPLSSSPSATTPVAPDRLKAEPKVTSASPPLRPTSPAAPPKPRQPESPTATDPNRTVSHTVPEQASRPEPLQLVDSPGSGRSSARGGVKTDNTASRTDGLDRSGQRARKGGGKGILAVLLVILLVGGAAVYSYFGPKKADSCQLALESAATLESQGDLAGARAQAVKAVAACSANREQQARSVLTTIDQGLTAQAACDRRFSQIEDLIGDRRLQSAKKSLDRLDTPCLKFARSAVLLDQLRTAQNAAMDSETEARKLLDGGDAAGAGDAIERLATADREYPALTQLRQQLQSIRRAQADPPGVTPPATGRSSASSPVTAPSVSPPTASLAHDRQKLELARGFLRDAEQALGQMRFDAANTYVDSALRIDPQNPEAQTLARLIRERELQYLKDRTTLK